MLLKCYNHYISRFIRLYSGLYWSCIVRKCLKILFRMTRRIYDLHSNKDIITMKLYMRYILIETSSIYETSHEKKYLRIFADNAVHIESYTVCWNANTSLLCRKADSIVLMHSNTIRSRSLLIDLRTYKLLMPK